jgi:hypothetical protein
MTLGPAMIFVPINPPTNYGGPVRYKRVQVVERCPLTASSTPPLSEREPWLHEGCKAVQAAIDTLKRLSQ